MFQFRDRVWVQTDNGVIEGYVYFVPQDTKEIYVVLTGQNSKPVLVPTKLCQKIQEGRVKPGRGRPKVKKEIK